MRTADNRTGAIPWIWLLVLVLAYGGLWLWRGLGPGIDVVTLGRTWWQVAATSLFGATLAGATGTSAGIVSIPGFEFLREAAILRFSFTQTMAATIVIHVFSAGVAAMLWSARLYGLSDDHRESVVEYQDFLGLVFTTVCFSIPAVIVTQNSVVLNERSLQTAFQIFSLVVGLLLLVFTFVLHKSDGDRFTVGHGDLYMAIVIGLVGGACSGIFTLGVGELLAVYLIVRQFPVAIAFAAATATSAITMIAALWVPISTGRIVWEIVLSAVPGAMVGSTLAFGLALLIGPSVPRVVAALWIVATSLYLIVRALL